MYGYPKELIDAQLKDDTNDVIILTFYIEENSQKYLLLALMKTCILISKCPLKESLNTKIKSIRISSDPVYSEKSGKMIL